MIEQSCDMIDAVHALKSLVNLFRDPDICDPKFRAFLLQVIARAYFSRYGHHAVAFRQQE